MQEQEVAKIEVGDGAAIPTPDDRGLVSAWWIALIGAVALLVLLPVIKPDPYLNILRFVPDGILITFQVTVLSISLAIVIGLVTGLGRISSNRVINLIASLYVEVVRGIPLLVQLFYIYYALGRFVRVPDLVAAVIAMLKDTSLVSILAVADILRRGREYSSESFNYFETYTMIALIYLLITLVLSKLISIMEHRLSHYERR